METTKPKSIQTNNPDLKLTLDGLGVFFGDISNDSHLGSQMIAQNITTEFAAHIKDVIENPLKHTYDGFNAMGQVMQALINDIFKNFFAKNKSLIKRVVNPYANNSLFYTIVLKKDTTENRAKLLSFLREYQETPYSRNFAVTLYFVPKEFEGSVVAHTEIAL